MVDLSHFQGAIKRKYEKLIMQNNDVFNLSKFDSGHAEHYQHVIDPIDDQPPPFVKQFKIPLKTKNYFQTWEIT